MHVLTTTPAALRFQPRQRTENPKKKPNITQPLTAKRELPSVSQNADTIKKITEEDDDEDGNIWAAEYTRRMREAARDHRGSKKGRKVRVKNVEFDDHYVHGRWTRLEAFPKSGTRKDAVHAWKLRLHMKSQGKTSSGEGKVYARPKNAYAPPIEYSFTSKMEYIDNDDEETPPSNAPPDDPEPYVPPVPAAIIPEDASGEDAYMRRMRMSGQPGPPAPGSSFSEHPSQPPPPQAPLGLSPQPISSDPNASTELPDSTTPIRSNRPGQKGFAKRLLEKYGWEAGSGLGAQGDGITEPLRHQTSSSSRKRKPESSSEASGWSDNKNMARIVGGKRRHVEDTTNEGTDAPWSNVVVFSDMLKGVDVQHRLEEGSLMQDLGEAMDRYGIVERLYLDRSVPVEDGGTRVFAKFTSALSAYRVIGASNGVDFLGNGNEVKSTFFDGERFERGEYALP